MLINTTIAALLVSGAAVGLTTLESQPADGSIAASPDMFDGPIPSRDNPAARLAFLQDYFGELTAVPVAIDFAGGTVGEYVDVIEDAVGLDFIVVMPGAESIAVPAITLTQITAADALATLQRGSSTPQDTVYVEFTDSGTAILRPDPSARRAERTTTFTISLNRPGQDEEEFERVVGAVEAAAVFLEDTALRVSIHEDTRILFMRGNPDSVSFINEAVETVLNQAVASERDRLAETYQSQLESAAREFEQLRASVELERTKAELEVESQRALMADQLRQMEMALDSLRDELTRARDETMMLERELERVRTRNAELESQLNSPRGPRGTGAGGGPGGSGGGR